MNAKKTLLLLVLLCVCPLALGQEDWRTTPFAPADKLPFEDVRSILETPDGALWFTSWGRGVARLLGSEWRVFTTQDGLASNFTRGLAYGPGTSIWVATQGGISYISEDFQVTSFTGMNLPLLEDPRAIEAKRLRNGTVLFGTESGDVIAYDDSAGTRPSGSPIDSQKWSVFVRKPSDGAPAGTPADTTVTEKNAIWSIMETRDGAIWVAQGPSGVTRYSAGQRTHYPIGSFGSRQVKSLWEAQDGTVWIAGSHVPSYLDATGWHEADFISNFVTDADAVCVAGTPDGRAIVGTSRLGLRIRQRDGQWLPLRFPESIGSPLVRTIMFDSRGFGWIGTKEGILQFRRPKWENMAHSQGTLLREGHAFYASPEQPPLAVDVNGRVVEFDGNQWRVLGTLPQVTEQQDMAPPSNGLVWILMELKLFEFSLTEQRVTRALDVPDTIQGRYLLRTSAGDLYVYGRKGACKLVGDTLLPCVSQGDAAGRNVRSMAEMKDGSLLVLCGGTDLGTDLEIWNDGRRFVVLNQDELAPPHYFACAGISRDGRVWLGTIGSGVWVFDDQHRLNYRIEEGLQSGRVVCMRQASDDTMWFGAENLGVSSLLDDRWTNFSHQDGLPSDIVGKICEYPKGTIWVATRNEGVYRHTPDATPPSTTIQAHPESIPFRGTAVFSFTGYDTWNATLAGHLDFSWRIIRRDGEEGTTAWSPFARASSVATPRLPSGHYTFEVRASDEDRNVDPTPAIVAFEVQTPFYLRASFYVPFTILLLIALGLMVLIFLKTRALRHSQAEILRLAQAVDQAAEVIVVTDPNGVIQYVNPAFERVTGYTREEAIGQNPNVLKSGKHPDEYYRQLWETITSGDIWTGQFTNKKKDGTLYEEEASISPVRDRDGRIIHFVAVKRDITDQEKLAAQLRHAQKMEAVGQLAGGIAHDFNNLLQAIQGYTQLAMDGIGRNNAHYADLREVMRASDQATTLTRQLLSFSRREVLQPRNIDLNQVIADMSKMLRRLIGENIELHATTDVGLKSVYADPTQIGQVLVNLFVNARDAMPNGGTVTVETRNATIDEAYCEAHPWAKTGQYAVLSVSDTGIGMAPEVRERIFEPFFTTKELGRGTGLGLATVYGIVKQHEGMISVYSEPGDGTTFTLYLPAVDAEAEEDLMLTPVPVPRGTGTLLLAEDDEIVRNLGVQILSHAGYNVLIARDGEEAVSVFHRHIQEIDAAILDVVMPKLSGRDACERIQTLRPGLPVIFTSGYSLSLLDSGFLSGSNAICIQKPYNPRELLMKVRQVMRPAPKGPLGTPNPGPPVG